MNEFILIISGILGATLTFFISEKLRQGAVKASALLSLIVGLFFYCFPDLLSPYLTKHIQIVFIGSSFIGMVSASTMKSYTLLAIAGTLFTIIYMSKKNVFNGYGGSLGTLAFVSLLSTMAFATAVSQQTKIKNTISVFWKKIFKRKK
ncbi:MULTISPECIES: hypothetical protein [Winogradskyella]|uniref:hypothetical protein n=1 Tax=Winogradskyella TaxID=286104 RepID=UPI0015CD1B4C|nr:MULTISPECIES: hypothetical protein [Winogradskyella]QNK76198.1 hypothetical protein H7F37_08520 [Winogradskyella sp. PAMC22761]